MIPLLLFVVGPIADLILLVRFGQSYGFLATVGVVLGTAAVGIAVLGRRSLAPAARLGGALLVLPGLITDAVGLALLFPPTRFLLTAIGRRWAKRAMDAGALRVSFLRFDAAGAGAAWGEARDAGAERPDAPAGLDPRNQILVPPPQGGGDPAAR